MMGGLAISQNYRGGIACDWVKVLRPTRHKKSHFGDVLPSLGLVLYKLNPSQQVQSIQEQNDLT